jgi:hypothetical protein
MLCDLLEKPSHFLQHTERFAMSVIFSAVYGVRLEQLGHPTMVEFYAVWETMLQCLCILCWLALSGFLLILHKNNTDFQPGSLLLDFLPCLQRLPKKFQPWLHLAHDLRKRDVALHTAFLSTLKKASKAGEASHCFGKMLVEVSLI